MATSTQSATPNPSSTTGSPSASSTGTTGSLINGNVPSVSLVRASPFLLSSSFSERETNSTAQFTFFLVSSPPSAVGFRLVSFIHRLTPYISYPRFVRDDHRRSGHSLGPSAPPTQCRFRSGPCLGGIRTNGRGPRIKTSHVGNSHYFRGR